MNQPKRRRQAQTRIRGRPKRSCSWRRTNPLPSLVHSPTPKRHHMSNSTPRRRHTLPPSRAPPRAPIPSSNKKGAGLTARALPWSIRAHHPRDHPKAIPNFKTMPSLPRGPGALHRRRVCSPPPSYTPLGGHSRQPWPRPHCPLPSTRLHSRPYSPESAGHSSPRSAGL